MTAYNIYLKGKIIDTVFYTEQCDKQYIYNSLVNHDGYDQNIIVRKRRCK